MADSRTDSASSSAGGESRNHATADAAKPPRAAVEAPSLRALMALCLALVLLVAVAPSNASSRQDHQAVSSTAVALRLATGLDHELGQSQSESSEFNFQRYESLLSDIELINLTRFQILTEVTELMHSLTLMTKNISFLDVIGRMLNCAITLGDNFIVKHQDEYAQLAQDTRRNLLALPLTNAKTFGLDGQNLQIAVLERDDSLRDPGVALCSPRGKESRFEEIFRSTSRGTDWLYDKCYFALALTPHRSSKVAIVAYPASRIIRPLPSIVGHQIHNSRVVDVAIDTGTTQGNTSEDTLLSIFFKPSLTGNATKGCSFWSKAQGNWTTDGCWVDIHVAPDLCHCNLSAQLKEDANGGQYIVYEYSRSEKSEVGTLSSSTQEIGNLKTYESKVILDYDRIRGLLDNLNNEEAERIQQDYILEELVVFLHSMTNIGFIDDDAVRWASHIALHALTNAEDALKHDANLTNALMEDLHVIGLRWARDNAHDTFFVGWFIDNSISSASPVALEAHQVLSNQGFRAEYLMSPHQLNFVTLRLGLPESETGVKINPSKQVFLSKAASHESAEPELSFHFSVASADKVHFAAIAYPESKSFLPLTRSLPAVFSYHVLEVAIVSEAPSSERLVTFVHVPDGPRRASTSSACAVWTGTDWSAQTCWPESGIGHACTCNLSAHALEIGTFLPLLVYEAIEAANFSPKGALGGLDVLYVVSSTVSLICLLLIAITAAVFPCWRLNIGNKFLLQLSLALSLYQIMLLFRETHHVYKALNRDAGAFVAFAVATHYSRLAHYAWMLVMSALQLRRMLTNVGAPVMSHFLVKVSALAWGLPLVPLAVLLCWDLDAHFARPDKLTHLVLYLVPGVAVTAINCVALAIIASRVLACFCWGKVADQRRELAGVKLLRRQMSILVLFFFLFGIPTAFEISNDLWGHSVSLEVLFKVFDPIRGAILFVYFVLLDDNVLKKCRQKMMALNARSARQQDFEMK